MELTFLDLTLPENSLLRYRQASMPAIVKKTVATTIGIKANTRLFCAGCWVVTVGGVSAVSVTFLIVSFGRTVVMVEESTIEVTVVVVVVLGAVGNVEASATGTEAVSIVTAATVVAFCVTTTAVDGRAVGTLFVELEGSFGADGILTGGDDLFGGMNETPLGKFAPLIPFIPLIGIDGGGGGRNCDDKKLVGRPPTTPFGFLPPLTAPGPSTLAQTCVLDVK